MKTETLLPLGKLDPGLRAPDVPLDVTGIGEAAAQVEALGYDALVVEETKDDPYQLLAMAAVATTTLGLGTSVAMAFPAFAHRDCPVGVDPAEGLGRPGDPGARLAGAGPCPSPVRHGNGRRRGRGCATTWAPCGRCGAAGRTAPPWTSAASTTT